jgi:hypothetical protein
MDDPKQKMGKDAFVPVQVRSFVVILTAGVVAYKIVMTPCALQFDFSSFLALALALFSVGLSAMFYFKATDTSNAFYDNTYKFSQDIAELLVRIESGFGEKLRHLDEAYKGMKDSFDQLPSRLQIKDAKKELKEEEQQVQQIQEERRRLLEEFAARAKIQDAEKTQFLSKMKEKDEAFHIAQEEIALLKARLRRAEQMRSEGIRDVEQDVGLMTFIAENVLPLMGGRGEIPMFSPSGMRRRFAMVREKLPEGFLDALRRRGLVDGDGDLTGEGFTLVRRAARSRIHPTTPPTVQ